jgi:hypothetical protein
LSVASTASSTARWAFVEARTLGVDDANSTPPFSRWAASVSNSTTTIAANSQSIANEMNGNSNT